MSTNHKKISCILCGKKSKISKYLTDRKQWLYCCTSCLDEPGAIAETCCHCDSLVRYFKPYHKETPGFICLLCYLKIAINNE